MTIIFSSSSKSFIASSRHNSMVDRTQYKVGLVVSVENCGNLKSSKTLKACKVNVGDEQDFVTVVTAAPNVREGSRLAVALEGATFENDDGEEVTVKRTSVGGIMSDGMFCDSKMLGWTGGAEGVAAQIPDSVPLGDAPPASKPRPGQSTNEVEPPSSSEVQGLFEKKLTKEEKKKLAEEKRKAKRAAKEANSKDPKAES